MFKLKTSAPKYDEAFNSNKGDRNPTPINANETSQMRHLSIPHNQSRHSSIAQSRRSSTRYDGGYSADITPAQIRIIDNIDNSARLRKTLQRNSMVLNGYSSLSEN